MIKEIFSNNIIVFIRKYIFVILTALGILFMLFQTTFLGVGPFAGVLTGPYPAGNAYGTYYFGAKHFSAGDNVYFKSKQNIKFIGAPPDEYVYPPFMVAFFVPFGLLPFISSYYLFISISLILFLLSIYFLSRILPKRKLFFWLAVIAFFSSPIMVSQLYTGEPDILILSLVVASFIFSMRKKSILSGILIGLGALLKLTPLIFLPYFFIKDRKAFWSSTITIAAISACFSPSMWADFFKRISGFASTISSGNFSNSLLGVLYNKYTQNYFSYATFHLIFLCLIALILGAVFFFIYKNKDPDRKSLLLEYGILSSFMIIIPPVALLYNGVHLLIPLAAYWSIRFKGILNKWTYFIFDILVYLLISQPMMSPFLRNFAIYHIFSLRPIILLCFVGLFIYIINKKYDYNYQKS